MCSNETPSNSPPRLPLQFAGLENGPRALLPIDQYRLQLYQYAVAERLRYPLLNAFPSPVPCYPLFPRILQPEEPKPQHSYIGLIAMAILSTPEAKLVLSDIYQHILDHYPYFRTRGPGWRNSIRHNLSLNDCFIKAGRSPSGKSHFWAIHPANVEDFKKGDFRRRKAQRKVRKHMGLAVDEDGADSPSPPPLSVSPPTGATLALAGSSGPGPSAGAIFPTSAMMPFRASGCSAAIALSAAAAVASTATSCTSSAAIGSRKRQFDVASLLAPDSGEETNEEDIDVVSSDHQNHHHQEQSNDSSLSAGGGNNENTGTICPDRSWPIIPIVNYYQALLQARPLNIADDTTDNS